MQVSITARLPSGRESVFDNRVGWARTYIKKAALIESPRRAIYKIAPRGLDVLKSNPPRIDNNFLSQYAEFRAFRTPRVQDGQNELPTLNLDEGNTPEETLQEAYERMRKALENELLERVKACSPAFFERLVVELVVKLGYGGSLRDAGKAIGKSGDGGIDGIIKEDRLGLDLVYLQAKRWETNVGRPEIQKFAGALQGHRAKKGVFLTTSEYSRDAVEYAKQIDSRIALIGGAELARLMIDHGLGVSLVESYNVNRIDSDFFTED
ncbi:MAG: restriction endonuclease [Elusimicrobia bacterium]|nr:restriction endonuclease [Elusimicrobiota bacterium]